ncbi:MAG: acetyl-CoA carboxylase biotin carboxylase subunit [Deltaproteobacteria bacterium]|nr:MAG: acetyl-CoA carboxylase biotin carboxylase subunit [Deltaproteobacteria bacterium]
MFKKILIANRGEIAVRVIRACREMGIQTVAIYSDVDRDALHVRYADEAYPCGPPPARDSYLQIDRILEIARRSGAEAIHPGYGFLAENGEFSDRCAQAGIVFIGPSGDVMRAMGDKVTARQTMEKAGVPIVPGTTERLSDEAIARWIRDVGPPVMVKATAGGGGKGMRLVRSEDEIAGAVARARGEARASFGDDGLYVERFVEEPRHIEIQVLADAHGTIVHLFERECSIQRRHQKVIEEAPGNRITPELREKMGEAAVAAARAAGYVGAGTCEFLMDKNDHFYFLEMNTRVQVEHPITEAITGVDIVKAMIRAAAGEPLGIAQQDLSIRGHAIEARIYAEDPDQNFIPSPGDVVVYRPAGGIGVRVDSGVYQGAKVTVFYDPMVAKLVTWGADRGEAIQRLKRALSEFVVKGIKTSIPFHQKVVRHPIFLAGRYDTGFIDAHMDGGRGPAAEDDAEAAETRRIAQALAAIAAYRRDKQRAAGAVAARGGTVAEDPWKTFGRRAQMRGGLR